ncbi:unnamed protein product [Thlaspi arvense]|uniref:Zinc transporter 11 n=1 Tax=Thlaspi arvense TaxID=13288 RepID=A0AAU9SMR8_THLAR|nr:unnamed protein product [Thlaspi arvense]
MQCEEGKESRRLSDSLKHSIDTQDQYPRMDLDSDPSSKPLILVKLWCLLIVFVAALVAGVSPYVVKWSEGFILLGTQFAGGVFLGIALMQFLSDSDEAFENLTARSYPFAFMLASVGYLLAMLADFVVVSVYGKHSPSDSEGFTVQGSTQQRKSIYRAGTSQSQIQQVEDEIDHFTKALLFRVISFGDSVLLITALCFHSVFESIAIGVADTKARTWRALWTVTLHKVFTAIAMGISILRMIPDHPLVSCIAYAFAFAISCPVGVAIGIVIDATAPGIIVRWIFAVFMSLACGVFIYISVNHLLVKGYFPQRTVMLDSTHRKFLAVVLGVGVIAILMIWDESTSACG